MGGDTIDDQIKITGTAEYSQYSVDPQTTYAIVSLKAPTHEPEMHTPLDLVIALDVSGSMAGEKLTLAKKSVEFIIKNLRSSDRLSLVVYDTNVTVKFGLTLMDTHGKETANTCVASLHDGSSTNLSGGLLQAMAIINERIDPNMVGSVLLFTDGLANVGIQDSPKIIETMRACYNPAGKYSVHTFGFGSDHNAILLKGLSEGGSGMYFYVKTADEIPTAFADCLGGLVSTVGQLVEVQLECLNNYYIANLHTNKLYEFQQSNKVCTVKYGDIQSEEQKDLLFQLGLPSERDLDGPQEQQEPHQEQDHQEQEQNKQRCKQVVAVLLRLTYFSCLSNEKVIVEEQFTIARATEPLVRECNKHVYLQKLRVNTTGVIQEAQAQAEKGNLETARDILAKEMECLKLQDDRYAKELLDDVNQCHSGMVDRISYNDYGSKFMSSCHQTHSEQRSNVAGHSRGYVSYETSCKARFKACSKE